MIRIKDWNEERGDPDVDIFNISQNVQDTVIHLEVDEEQWRKITKGSKRQATWAWSPTMSGLRFPDTPHAQNTAQRSTRLDRLQTKEYPVDPWMTYVRYTSNKPRWHTSRKTSTSRKNTASKKPFVESSSSRSWRISIYSSAGKDEGLHQPGYLLVSPFIVSDLHGRARCILLYDYLLFYDYTSF